MKKHNAAVSCVLLHRAPQEKNEKKKHGCCKYMRVKFLLQPSRTRHTWQTKLHLHPFCLQFPLQDMHYWATNIGTEIVRSKKPVRTCSPYFMDFFAASQKAYSQFLSLIHIAFEANLTFLCQFPGYFITCYSLKLSLQAVRCWMEPNAT